jgi:sensor histidine kinase YesM
MDEKGLLLLSFKKSGNVIEILIDDNGIGITASKNSKTSNQQKQNGRGISNTLERIKILNELYHKNIRCKVEDKAAPNSGVKVTLIVPHSKNTIV